jgi:hypothetical protein
MLGTKIIFWDLREPFIDNLYKHSLSQARLETVTESLDLVSRRHLVQLYFIVSDDRYKLFQYFFYQGNQMVPE